MNRKVLVVIAQLIASFALYLRFVHPKPTLKGIVTYLFLSFWVNFVIVLMEEVTR